MLLMIPKKIMDKAAGINAVNWAEIIGGTCSGSLIARLYFVHKRKMLPTTKEMTIALNIPDAPSQDIGREAAPYGSSGTTNGVTIRKHTREIKPTAMFDLAHLYVSAKRYATRKERYMAIMPIVH